MFLNFKKKFILKKLNFKKIIYKKNLNFLNLNYSFLFFFIKDFNIFKNFFYFNRFFINYILKLIFILKILLIKKCNLLFVIKLKKKNNFLKNYFFLFYFNFFSFKINKVFDNFNYFMDWLYRRNFFYFLNHNYGIVILLNFNLKGNLCKKINLFNMPIVGFGSINSDYPIFLNSNFIFYLFFYSIL